MTKKKTIPVSIPTHGLSMAGSSYASAVVWIAENEPSSTGSVAFLKHSGSVCLLAFMAGVGTERIAEDVIRHRKYG